LLDDHLPLPALPALTALTAFPLPALASSSCFIYTLSR
jgi:hypothetical protein